MMGENGMWQGAAHCAVGSALNVPRDLNGASVQQLARQILGTLSVSVESLGTLTGCGSSLL
jgi:hypothetical protein